MILEQQLKTIEDKNLELKYAREHILEKLEKAEQEMHAAEELKKQLEEDIARARDQIGSSHECSFDLK